MDRLIAYHIIRHFTTSLSISTTLTGMFMWTETMPMHFPPGAIRGTTLTGSTAGQAHGVCHLDTAPGVTRHTATGTDTDITTRFMILIITDGVTIIAPTTTDHTTVIGINPITTTGITAITRRKITGMWNAV
jgi:hypothetical protein